MAAIGLLFGSFNPVHHGHLLLATHLRETAGLDEVWFIVSPQNPFKLNSNLADEYHRLEMVKIAVENVPYFNVSDIEFQLDKPSYTHITLKKLQHQFPSHQFSLIIGKDNAANFQEWKEADWILNNVEILVYNRTAEDKTINFELTAFNYYNLPLFDISSTIIRKRVKENQSVRYFVPENVEHYIRFHKLYQ